MIFEKSMNIARLRSETSPSFKATFSSGSLGRRAFGFLELEIEQRERNLLALEVKRC